MLNIWRLRNVLRKLETSENLAKILIQTATAIAGILDKKYLVAVQLEKHTKMTASTKTMTPQMKINPTSLTKTNTSSKHDSDVDVAVTELPVPVPVTTETKATYTEQVEQTEKRIKAATFNVSLFSQTVSNGGVVEKESGCGSFRKHNVLIDHQNYGYGTSQARDTQNQTNYKMSDAKINEVTQQDGEAAPKQLDEEPSCNGASCGSEDNKQKQNGKEKPCFNSSLADILHFMELVGNLKHTKRTGWVLRDVNDCESISGHMYRMSMMTFLLEEGEGLNRIRCMELALVHDLAESLVGDLTPFCGVAKEDKKAMELKAMADICKLIEPRGKRIMELFEEYEEGQSAESKFVKDLDRLDMVMQAFEYEKRDNCLMKHQEFFDSTEGKFQHPFVKKLVKEICDQRKAIVEAKLIGNGDLKYETVTPNCPPCLEHKNERS